MCSWPSRPRIVASVVAWLAAVTMMPTVAACTQRPSVTTIRVRGEPQCRDCRLEAREVGRIGREGEHLVEWPQDMWQDRRGRIFVMQSNSATVPVVFDSTGRYIQSIGRIGEGPGEFTRAAAVFGDQSDTTFIHDWIRGRLTVLDPNLRIVRQQPFPPGALKGAALSDGTLLANAVTRDRASPGFPFQLFNRSGDRVGVVGTGEIPLAPSTQILFAYRVAAARGDGFWAVPLMGRHLIERWTTPTTVTIFRRDRAPWFVEVPRDAGETDHADPPVSSMRGVWEDRDGLVWTLVRVADRRGPAPRDSVRTVEGAYTVPRDLARESDTIVEVLDPRSGMLVASQRFDGLFAWALGNGRVGSLIEYPDGRIEIAVLDLSLVRTR